MSETPIGKYMTVRPDEAGGWYVSARDGGRLGRVSWYPRWKQYEFLPAPGSGYSACSIPSPRWRPCRPGAR